MIYRLALLAIIATGLIAGDAEAQLSLRNLTKKSSKKSKVSSRPLTNAQMSQHVSQATRTRATQKRSTAAQKSQVRKVSHVKKASCDTGIVESCGSAGGCGCSSGCAMSVASPRCFKFDSGCGGGAIGCDACCGTIFSELYCSMHNMFSRASSGCGLFGGLGRPSCGGGLFGCTSGGLSGGGLFGLGCSGGGSCSGTLEPGCGIADACGCGDAGCSGGCDSLEPACGIADACGCGDGGCSGGCELSEPACGIASVGGCCDAVEPACGIASSGCSGGSCFQDLLSTPCGGCRGGGGFLASLGSMLFGGCGSGCGCSSCSAIDGTVYAEPGCGIADCAEPACGIADSCGDAGCSGGCGDAGCSGGCDGGCAVRKPYGDSRYASRSGGRTLKYTISQNPESREPVYVGQRPTTRVDAVGNGSRTAKKPTVKRTSHSRQIRTTPTRASRIQRTKTSQLKQRSTRKIGLVSHEQIVPSRPLDQDLTVMFEDDLTRDVK